MPSEISKNPELQEIKRLRKKHSLTQAGLAKLAGVSQSLVAKIESGMIDPTFSHAKRILDTLHGIDAEKEPKAGQIMTSQIIAVSSSERVSDVIRRMKAASISQLPVMEDRQLVGLVSESNIIEKVAEGKSLVSLKVSDVMEEAPPIVVKSTPVAAVTELLRHFPLVVVAENGKPRGIITKSDILKKIV